MTSLNWLLNGMFRRSASLAIPHLKSFAAIPSLSLVQLGHTNRSVSCHTNRSVKLPSSRHFQDQFLTTNKEKWGKKKWACVSQCLCFCRFAGRWHRTIRIRIQNRSRIARYNATKIGCVLEGWEPPLSTAGAFWVRKHPRDGLRASPGTSFFGLAGIP